MKKAQYTAEQIVSILPDAETTTAVATSRKHGVSEQSSYRWHKQIDGLFELKSSGCV